MNEQLHINDQVFHVVKIAAQHVPYSKDYITRLAREKKIRAVHVTRQWYVDIDALVQYEQIQKLETDARNRQLKTQRKVEHAVREMLMQSEQRYLTRSTVLAVSSFAVVALIVSVGFVSGVQLSNLMPASAVLALSPAPTETVDTTDPQTVLTPVFTASADHSVVVENGRSIPTPETKHNWLRIRYE